VAPVPACWHQQQGDFDLLTLKVVSESRVTWAISVQILVFLGLPVLNLGPMNATDRQTDVRQKHRLMPPPIRGRGIINYITWYIVLRAVVKVREPGGLTPPPAPIWAPGNSMRPPDWIYKVLFYAQISPN